MILEPQFGHNLEPKLENSPGPGLKPFTQPCGPDCYMQLIGIKNCPEDKHSDPANKENSSTSINATNANIKWTGSDQSLFHAIYKVYQNNYCAIAKTMLNKTCQQVYEFAIKEELVHLNVELSQKHVAPPKKNKKSWIKYAEKVQQKRNETSNHTFNYSPCNHPNEPCNEMCSCIKSLNFCEKFCNCDSDCQNRFPGCECRGRCQSNKCKCYVSERECDPDLCRVSNFYQIFI